MGDQLFNLFGDTILKPKNVVRQPLFNDENQGKVGLTGPIKPNEPINKAAKAGDTKKKTFLSNTGVALQSTPAPKTFSPFSSMMRSKMFSPMVYNDVDNLKNNDKRLCEEMEFNSPIDRYDGLQRDLIDCFLFAPDPVPKYFEYEKSPSPILDAHEQRLEYETSYKDDFFLDDFNESAPYLDDDLPDLF